jgi:ABC-type multidrug transport system ATPase subunit
MLFSGTNLGELIIQPLQIRELMKELTGQNFFYSTHIIESIDKIYAWVIMIN